MALPPGQLIELNQSASGDGKQYYINGGAGELAEMFNGTGAFTGKRRLSFAVNVGTLVQPITVEEYKQKTVPVPKALFSHKDQTEQWQTSMPQGLAELTGWAGRAADVLHSTHNSAQDLDEHIVQREQRPAVRQGDDTVRHHQSRCSQLFGH